MFDFRLGRGRDGPKQFLGSFAGILQTHGYAAYDQAGGPKLVHAACWAHARRKFHEAVKLSPQAGPKVAAIVSVVETCRRLMIPARQYLGAILPGLAGTSIQELAELTPAAWAARNR